MTNDTTASMLRVTNRVVTPVNTIGCTNRTTILWDVKGIVAKCFRELKRKDDIVVFVVVRVCSKSIGRHVQ
jgi:hypothetical protein